MESDAGEIPQAAAEAKNDKRYEGRIAVGIGRFTLVKHMLWHTAKSVLLQLFETWL